MSSIPTLALTNEPVLDYAPGSAERHALQQALLEQTAGSLTIDLVIGGKRISTEQRTAITAPQRHAHHLATVACATADHARHAITAALGAREAWAAMPVTERAAIFLRAADLLAGPWRQRLNAATMLGQSKTAYQAEIDSACELIDFLRFNAKFACDLISQQPISVEGVQNSTDYRPLEGFVYAITPFNFTAIAGNLATAPALMGNTVIWKPSGTAALSNFLFMELLEEAGLPPGVINFIPGNSAEISGVLLSSPHLAGVHFTGSTAVFDQLWRETALNLPKYRSYPRLVGETGGKGFVIAHASADIESLVTGLLRGAFEYQGQKCSAASRAYVPASLWQQVRSRLLQELETIRLGDVCEFSNFMGAVIDRKAYDRLANAIADARTDPSLRVLTDGEPDDSVGYFIPPTVIQVDDASHPLMATELFGPVLAIHVYPDNEWANTLQLADSTSPYALTGAVFAQDPGALIDADRLLRFSAGNYYINDKPTGAVVGQQPFGGGRRSGTNDKAGSPLNLLRWVSARTIKRSLSPATDYRYPFMELDD